MQRRNFLAGLAAGAGAAALAPSIAVAEGDGVPYSRSLYESALKEGKPFLLDFYATW